MAPPQATRGSARRHSTMPVSQSVTDAKQRSLAAAWSPSPSLASNRDGGSWARSVPHVVYHDHHR